MEWIKKGLIYNVDFISDWMETHAQLPTVDLINKDTLIAL